MKLLGRMMMPNIGSGWDRMLLWGMVEQLWKDFDIVHDAKDDHVELWVLEAADQYLLDDAIRDRYPNHYVSSQRAKKL